MAYLTTSIYNIYIDLGPHTAAPLYVINALIPYMYVVL